MWINTYIRTIITVARVHASLEFVFRIATCEKWTLGCQVNDAHAAMGVRDRERGRVCGAQTSHSLAKKKKQKFLSKKTKNDAKRRGQERCRECINKFFKPFFAFLFHHHHHLNWSSPYSLHSVRTPLTHRPRAPSRKILFHSERFSQISNFTTEFSGLSVCVCASAPAKTCTFFCHKNTNRVYVCVFESVAECIIFCRLLLFLCSCFVFVVVVAFFFQIRSGSDTSSINVKCV